MCFVAIVCLCKVSAKAQVRQQRASRVSMKSLSGRINKRGLEIFKHALQDL